MSDTEHTEQHSFIVENIRRSAVRLSESLGEQGENGMSARTLFLIKKLDEFTPAENVPEEEFAAEEYYAGLCLDLIRICREAVSGMSGPVQEKRVRLSETADGSEEREEEIPEAAVNAGFVSSVSFIFAAGRALNACLYALTGDMTDRAAARRINSEALREEKAMFLNYEDKYNGVLEKILFR